MPNKANKFSKKAKFLTANAEVNLLPKEPHSALAAVTQAPPTRILTSLIRAVTKVVIVQETETALIVIVQETETALIAVVLIKIRRQSTGLKST